MSPNNSSFLVFSSRVLRGGLSEVYLMEIEVSGFLELSNSLVETMKELEVDTVCFFKKRLDEAVKVLDQRISNELQILSPCLTSALSLQVVD